MKKEVHSLSFTLGTFVHFVIIMQFILNNKLIDTNISPGTVTLDYLRDIVLLKGSKEVCREGDCGACTVLLGEIKEDDTVFYRAVCSCILPLGDVEGKHLVTIEGINQKDLTPIQQAFVDYGATQCGFCTPGFVMSLTGFFLNSPTLDDASIMDAIAGNVCRCTGYASIIRATNSLTEKFRNETLASEDRMAFLIQQRILPEYFKEIPQKLKEINNNGASQPVSEQDAAVVAGATDLYVQRPDDFKEADIQFTLKEKKFSEIWTDEQYLYIGAGVVTEEFKRDEILTTHLPQLPKFIPLIASKLIRERATLAGNIVNASPIGDMTIILLALNAELGLNCKGEKRTLALKEFYKGYKEFDLKSSEKIEWIRVPLSAKENLFNFEKVSKRTYLDIASVNSAMSIRVKDNTIQTASVSAGGVSPVPCYLKNTSEFLTGRTVTAETMKEAANVALKEISPISDVRGSKEYKSLLLRQFIYAHFMALFPEHKLEASIKT